MESPAEEPMTNTSIEAGKVTRLKRFFVTLTGLLLGLVIGIFSYLLITKLFFDSEDSGIGLSSTESPRVGSEHGLRDTFLDTF